MRVVMLLALGFAACGTPRDQSDANDGLPRYDDAGLPYCWIYDCPTDPGATTCGSCNHAGYDQECPPGFVCSCTLSCVKGPRSYDGGACFPLDAAVGAPDAMIYQWPACDDHHQPGAPP